VKHLDILDLSDDARELIRECEATGARTAFERNGRPVAVLVSHDEYMALRETIEIANDALLFAKIAEADESTSRQVDESSSGRTQLDDSTTRRLERIVLADAARAGLDELEGVIRRRALSSLARINLDPIAGAPLFEPLKDWSYRTDDLRIIYKIVAEAKIVAILRVMRGVVRSCAAHRHPEPRSGEGP
jgi:PHD/YefM family antitoxin component YafN of YafNO toxin-antitoxin module/mRNA-degrading endonuclease RelE of RelBE toxin-antitoxin system